MAADLPGRQARVRARGHRPCDVLQQAQGAGQEIDWHQDHEGPNTLPKLRRRTATALSGPR